MLVLHDRRAVDIAGNLPSECFVDEVVFRCRGQVFHTAHDIGDAHQMVVDDIGEVIGREAVAFEQNLLVERFVVDRDRSEHFVIEGCLSFRDRLADDIGFAGSDAFLTLFRCQLFARIVIFEAVAFGFALFLQAFLVAEAVMSAAAGDQLFGIFFVKTAFDTLGLYIRTVCAADVRTLVMVQTAGFQRIVNNICCTFDKTSLVGILDTENIDTLGIFSCDKIGIQGSAQIADMHISGRTRCESCSDRHCFTPFFPVNFTLIGKCLQ